MPKSRIGQWVATGSVLALVLGASVAGSALRHEITAATGLDRDGGSPTVAPSTFVEPTPEPTPTTAAGLLPAAAVAGQGELPDADALAERLEALDVSGLVTPEDEPATVAWEVVDVATGEVLASKGADELLIPASNTKTLTAVALFHAFDGTERFATTVTRPAEDTVVLVGGGDPLLTSEPAEEGAYPAPPSLRELSRRTARQLADEGRKTIKVAYDASWFESPGWAKTWPTNYRSQVTPISALWVDEGRIDGARQVDPALAAAQTFAKQLAESGIRVEGEPTKGTGGGEELARVESLPVHALAEQAMQRSNNSFTEVLGFQLARATGHPSTFAGATAAIEEQLTELGIWADGAHLDDASGLSRSNLVTAHMLASANRLLATDPQLTNVLDGLPTAGVTGTLRSRFTDELSRPARGVARAKTGTLSFVSTLAGITTTRDDAVLAFAVLANGQVNGWNAKVLEDQVAGVITSCGC